MRSDSTSRRLTPPWPYDWHELGSALDIETIEIHGEHQLHRALNIKRLIAFVGSGVSMAYGRVSWTELARLHIDTMREFIDREGEAKATGLARYLDQLGSEPGEMRSDRLYAGLLACEQIWRAKAADQERPEALGPMAEAFGFNWLDEKTRLEERLIQREERGSHLFRAWIKRETYDELPHVRRLIRGWVVSEEKRKRDDEIIPAKIFAQIKEMNKTRLEDQLKEALKEFAAPSRISRRRVGNNPQDYMGFFNLSFLTVLDEVAKVTPIDVPRRRDWNEQVETIRRQFRVVTALCLKHVDGTYLRPVRAFAVGLALDLARLSERLSTLSTDKKGLPAPLSWIDDKEVKTRASGPLEAPRKSERDTIRRHQQVPTSNDPLYQLSYVLGIKRFLTTNYDLEVERLFTNMGFKAQDGVETDRPGLDELEMVGPSGGRTRDFVLTRQSAVDLIDFAANESSYDFQVVHLHGRATDHHDVVITERDYQNTYVRDAINEAAFKEGIEIAFGGNPILFVGLSLGEGDVLRPLREFMTGSSRRNRALIALRDGRDDEVGRETFAKNAYSQYGVYVIHYGRVTSAGDHRPYWLDQLHKQIKKFVVSVETLAKLIEQYGAPEADISRRKTQRRSWASAYRDIRDIDFNIRGQFARELGENGLYRATLGEWSILDIDFQSDGFSCDIRFEVEILQALKRLAPAIAGLAHPDLLEDISIGERDAHCRAIASFLRTGLRNAAQRAETAIVTAALSAKLEGIKGSWDQWWRDWRSIPKSRSDLVEYEQLIPGEPVWGRHLGSDDEGEVANEPPALNAFLQVVPPLRNVTTRRIFTIVGASGSGKGNSFNALALHGKRMLVDQSLDYAGQLFVTFSFSIEIASVWDALIAFLHDPTQVPNLMLFKRQFGQENNENSRVLTELSRIDALRRVLTELPERLQQLVARKPKRAPRVLIAFNAIDILFDDRGHPKNDEIRQIISLLLESAAELAPLDLVLMCRDDGLPSQFRMPDERDNSRLALAIPMTLLPTRKQAKFGSKQEAIETHKELAAIIRSSRVLLKPIRYRRRSLKWVNDELKIDATRAMGGASEYYFHVLELPDPIPTEIGDWKRFNDVTSLLTNCVTRAMIAVDTRGADRSNALSRLFNTHLERRRFLYTLVLAVAKDVNLDLKLNDKEKKERLTKFFERLIAAVRGPDISVQDRVVGIVLDYWFGESVKHAAIDGDNARTQEEFDAVLHESVLRHLAVIGTPIKPDVLPICPEVRDRLFALGIAVENYVGVIDHVLGILVARRLVFRVRPTAADGGRGGSRYVVHRAIQRFEFRKLGEQRQEPSQGQIFTVSLHTTQQRQFPSLNAAGYEFIYKLVTDLSAYPSERPSPHEIAAPLNEQISLASRCLRAALGVTRNLFSIGVISRLSDIGGVHLTKPDRVGNFERHRLIVRWMFYYARHLYENRHKTAGQLDWPPYYRDELVWLANESAVFLQAQGQTYDASALFWFARRMARDIEGLQPGVLRTRILLNDAWCCIDRARLDDAEERFRSVMASPDSEETLIHVANGGRALLQHLRGRLDDAADRYESAIKGLEKLGRSRPVAEFHRNRGDLLRHLGKFEEAEIELLKSIQIAGLGDYVELVHHAQVARVRNQIERGVADPVLVTEVLNLAHQYAEQMDLARLLCEVLMVRALLLMRHGHSAVAGEFVTRAIRIATLSGLSLRKIAYLEILARIERVRGGRQSAERLRLRAIRAAHGAGYNLVVDRAERIRDELSMLPTELRPAQDSIRSRMNF